MMKKYFSLTLLLSMVLTLVSTIPVQAALDGTDPLDDTYPYIFLDYNTSVTTKTNGEGLTIAKAEWASGKGVGGTGALKVTDRNHNVNDPLVLPTLQDKESIQRNAYTISGWVKLVHTKKLDLQGNTIDENQDGKPDQWEFKSGPNLGVVLQYGYKENGSVLDAKSPTTSASYEYNANALPSFPV